MILRKDPTQNHFTWHFHCAWIGLCYRWAGRGIVTCGPTLDADFSICVQTPWFVWKWIVDGCLLCDTHISLTLVRQMDKESISNSICCVLNVPSSHRECGTANVGRTHFGFSSCFWHIYVSHDGQPECNILFETKKPKTKTPTHMPIVIVFAFAHIRMVATAISSFQPISELMYSTCFTHTRIFLPP